MKMKQLNGDEQEYGFGPESWPRPTLFCLWSNAYIHQGLVRKPEAIPGAYSKEGRAWVTFGRTGRRQILKATCRVAKEEAVNSLTLICMQTPQKLWLPPVHLSVLPPWHKPKDKWAFPIGSLRREDYSPGGREAVTPDFLSLKLGDILGEEISKQ